jgi:pyruvate formate lyase activating enzyme
MLQETLRRGIALGVCPAAAAYAGDRAHAAPAKSRLTFYPARYYEKLPGKKIKCTLCPKECVVGDRERGFCGARENRDGTYYTLVWGQVAAVNIDPIEKKPFFHFLPGKRAFSIATAGCNMDCKDCQNWEISQTRPEQIEHVDVMPPKAVVGAAVKYRAPVIAYTYGEPVIFYEFMLETAYEGHKQGVRSVMVSNGYICEKPMRQVARHLDAMKIDLKGFDEPFYVKYCVGTLQPVLDTIELVHSLGTWLELVYLVVPTLNDDPAKIKSMCRWLVKAIGPDVPMHFSRFTPHYQLKNLPPTPLKTLERCHAIAREAGMRYVYVGNVPGHKTENTFCAGCGKVVVARRWYEVVGVHLKDGKCPDCGRKIPGVWN